MVLRHLVTACLFAVFSLFSPAQALPVIDKPLVIGGQTSRPGQWPFVVALVMKDMRDNLSAQFCAGSLIHRQFVLTAAHCAEDMRTDEMEVLVKTQDLSRGGRRIAIAQIIVHPHYDPYTTDNDVALLKLAEPVKGIKPVPIAGLYEESARAQPGKTAITMGWGDMAEGGGQKFPAKMRHARVNLIDRSICNAPSSYDGQVTARMICAGVMDGGRDSCQGDSGGPLVVADRRGRFRLQVGIVSWGYGCAEPGFPGVYTRVAVLRDWIKGQIRARR